jgi:cellulose synthase/poly-beta-1,6-N-acetylglucosamine synthase-like glycosyltransferase
MQPWDYRLGINGVKRMQAAYNTALVAQRAFSAYWTDDIRAVGGWPDAIGDDIVLTWSLMLSRGIVQYEPTALGFTQVPDYVRQFVRQRSRWARGMFEGLRATRRCANRVVSRSSSPASTNWCRSSTPGSSSSGSPASSCSSSATR